MADSREPKRMLVTGGAGFIGTNFVHYWLERYADARVVVLDALTYAGNRANLAKYDDDPRMRFVHGDICDGKAVEALMREEQIDTIVHFAAESHVDRSILGPDAFVQTNIVGTHELLKAAKTVWLDGTWERPHRFHHVSTDEVYGDLGPDDPPFTETTPYAPSSPYAASKAASDHLVRAYHRTYGLDVTISNCSNNYGPYQFPEKLIPLAIQRILHGEPIPIYGDGQQIRDWLYVEDHCRGIGAILEKGRVGETYNIGGNCEMANIDLVKMLCQVVDRSFDEDETLRGRYPRSPAASGGASLGLLEYVQDRPGHDRRYAICAEKMNYEFGCHPGIGIVDGLSRAVVWYFDNAPWVSSNQNNRNW